MPLVPKHRRWLLVALVAFVVALVAGFGALALGGEDDPTAGPAARPSDATTTPTTAQPLPGTPATTTPGPSTSDAPAGDRPADDGSQATDGGGPVGGSEPPAAAGDHRTGRPGAGAPRSGPPCGDPANAAGPVAPVSTNAPAMQIRQRADVALARLQETTPPPRLERAWEGLLLYYHRAFQLAARAGAGPLAPAERAEIDRLTRDLYGKFGDEVSAHLRRRC